MVINLKILLNFFFIPFILILIFLCSSVSFGQDKFPDFLPKVDISQVWHSDKVPEHTMVYDPLIDDIINQTNLDSLVSYVRILSGEDSVWLNGLKVRIQHRISSFGNDLAADYIFQKLESYNLEVVNQIYSENGRNVYAIQPGYLYPDKQYIICAHYDAVADYCADDNASGVAAVLEAARIFSQYDFKYTLVYALWDEEETGHWGSKYYANQAWEDQSDIQGVLNIDMIGWDGNEDRLFDIHSRDIANSDSLANLLMITNSLYDLLLSPIIYKPGITNSDHSEFWNYGYGAILLIEAYYGGDLNPYYHSSDDRIDKFDLTFFHDLSKLSIGTISDLVKITEDTILVTVTPDTGYQTYTTEMDIKGLNTHFMDSGETLEIWLSQDDETIFADSVVVQNNTSLSAFFYIPMEATTGIWSVNVQTAIDGLLRKENSFEILSLQSGIVQNYTIPAKYNLNQNYPNPFNPRTIINYELPITNEVKLIIYNLLGQKVVTLVSEKQKAGAHQIEWNASEFASGVYYYQIKAGDFQDVKKMILLQ